MSEDTYASATVNTDKLVPTDTSKEPILWSGNDAHLSGTLHEVGRYFTRTGLFKQLLKHRAAPAPTSVRGGASAGDARAGACVTCCIRCAERDCLVVSCVPVTVSTSHSKRSAVQSTGARPGPPTTASTRPSRPRPPTW